jgi:peptidoglycan/LPS O-acetylase OafA/YrhL
VKRVIELDGLRALAIFAVLGCHYHGFAILLGGLPQFGWLGVDIFFALSGFLITRILLGMRNQLSPYKTFYARRAIRIFPPYLVAEGVLIVLAIVFHEHKLLSRSYLLHQLLFLQSFAMFQVRFIVDLLRHPNQSLHLAWLHFTAHPLPQGKDGLKPGVEIPASTYWSLSIEEYFYILWAPIVLRLSRKNMVRIGIFICVASVCLRWFEPRFEVSYLGMLFRFDALIYGAFLALLIEHWQHGRIVPRSSTFTRIFLSCVAILAAILYIVRPILGHEIRQSNLFAAFGLPAISIAASSVIGLLVLNSNGSWWFARLLRIPVLQFIGTISYTMYLVHMIVAFLVDLALQHGGFQSSSNLFAFSVAVVDTLLTVLVARLSWHFLEKPLLRWKDKHVVAVNAPTEPVLN